MAAICRRASKGILKHKQLIITIIVESIKLHRKKKYNLIYGRDLKFAG